MIINIQSLKAKTHPDGIEMGQNMLSKDALIFQLVLECQQVLECLEV